MNINASITVDQVIRVVATKGPVIPIQVSKELGGNTMFAGALLSQLVGQKKVFVSSLKVGGSPVYYVKEQIHRLQDFAKYLNEKDRRTYELLRQSRILRDNEQPALVRVSLRNIKDFAIPLDVTFGDEKEIFWKWYLLNEEDARALIKQNLNIDEKEREEKKESKSEEKKEEKEVETLLANFVPEEKEIPKQETIVVPEAKEEKKEQRQEIRQKLPSKDDFLDEITIFLNGKGIIIKNFEIKKKSSEIDLTLLVPSAVGQIEYYCKAKDKKKVSDSDVSSAYVQAQLKKLPAMLLSKGEMTKGAKELVSKDIKISIVKMWG